MLNLTPFNLLALIASIFVCTLLPKSVHAFNFDQSSHPGMTLAIKALRVQLNSSRVITVNKTQNLRILSVQRHKSGPTLDRPSPNARHSSESGESGQQVGTDSGEHSAPSCFRQVLLDTTFTPSERVFMGRFTNEVNYIPFASTNYYETLTHILTGQDMGVEDVGKLCLSRVWNTKKREQHIFGLEKTATLRCNAKAPKGKFGIHCKSLSEVPVSFQVAPLQTDAEHYMLVVGCLPNGEKFWYVLCSRIRMDKETRKAVLTRITALGFAPGKAMEPSYDECPNKEYHGYTSGSSEEDSSESAESEPPAVSNPSSLDKTYGPICFNTTELGLTDFGFLMKLATRKGYTVMASTEYYSAISKLLTAKELDDNNLDLACITRSKIKGIATGTLQETIYGFNNEASLECQHFKAGKAIGHRCKNKGFHPYGITTNALFTDSKTYVVVGGCLSTGERVWMVSSPVKHLDSSSKKTILRKLSEKYGFNDDEAIELNYDHCGFLPRKAGSSESKSSESAEKPKGGKKESTSSSSSSSEGKSSEEVTGQHSTCFPPSAANTLRAKDANFIKKMSRETAYIPMASPQYYESVSQALTGSTLKKAGVAAACVRRSWNKNFDKVTISGFNTQLEMDCDVLPKSVYPRMMCKSTAGGSETIQSTVQLAPVLTDRQRYIVVVGCHGHQMYWFVVSKEDHVDDSSKRAIHLKLSSLGFNNDAITLNYDKCSGQGLEKRKSDKKDDDGKSSSEEDKGSEEESTSSGHYCFKGWSDPLSDTDIKFVEKLRGSSIHIPMTSQAFYDRASLVLAGTTIADSDQDQACFTRSSGPGPDEVTISGFGTKKVYKCEKHDKTRGLHCMAKVKGQGSLSSYSIFPVLTDRTHFVLLVGCFQDGEKFWLVASRENHVDDFAHHSIQSKIATMGFPKDEIKINYHHCAGDNEHAEEHSHDFKADNFGSGSASAGLSAKKCDVLENIDADFDDSDVQFIKEARLKELYIPYANTEFYDALTHIITGKSLDDLDLRKACISRIYEPRSRTITVKAFGQFGVLQCTLQDTKSPGMQCSSKDFPMFNLKVKVVQTDKKSLFLVAGCLSDGTTVWAVLSTHNKLDSSQKSDISKELTDLDLSTEGVAINYEDCPKIPNKKASDEEISVEEEDSKSEEKGKKPLTKSKAKSSSDDEDSNSCASTLPKFQLSNSNREKVLRILGEGVYTVMADKKNYYMVSELLRGRPLSGDDELKGVCIFSVWTDKSAALFGLGSYKGFLDCDTSNIGSIQCKPNMKKMDNKEVAVYAQRYSVVWSDDDGHVLSVNCLTNGKSTWILLSNEKTISSRTRKDVLKVVEELGFDTADAYSLPYGGCDV